MSRVFSTTIMKKIARMPKPATAMIRNKQHVEHGRFHLHGGQQRALLVAPGADHEDLRREVAAQQVADRVDVDARLEADLNRVEVGDAGRRIDHAAELLQLADRHEDEARVVFVHLAFVEVDDGELGAERLGRRAGRWDS